jgi:hypothetical protein
MSRKKSKTPKDALWAGRPTSTRYVKPKNKMIKGYDVWVDGRFIQHLPGKRTNNQLHRLTESFSGDYRIYVVYSWEDKTTTKQCLLAGWR